MKSFEEHTDGRVYVRADGTVYIDTRENFAADFGRETDPIADGAIERIYVQDTRHALNGPDGTIGGGPMPYGLGDDAIAAVADLIAAQAARVAAGT